MSKFYAFIFALIQLFFMQSASVCAYTDTPSEAIDLNNRGVNNLNKGKMDEAVELLQKAIKISPNYEMALCNLSIAYNNQALLLVQNERTEEALHLLEKARYLYPSSQTSFDNENALIKRLGFNPDSACDRVNLANQAILRGDVEAFLAEFQEAIEIAGEKLNIDKGLSEDDFYRIYGDEIASKLNAAWNPESNLEPFVFQVKAHISTRKFSLYSADYQNKDAKLKEVLESRNAISQLKPLYRRQKNRILHFSFSHTNEKNEVRYEGNERDFF